MSVSHVLLGAGLMAILAVNRLAPGLLPRCAKWALRKCGSVVS